jgi:hypothetical protein
LSDPPSASEEADCRLNLKMDPIADQFGNQSSNRKGGNET